MKIPTRSKDDILAGVAEEWPERVFVTIAPEREAEFNMVMFTAKNWERTGLRGESFILSVNDTDCIMGISEPLIPMRLGFRRIYNNMMYTKITEEIFTHTTHYTQAGGRILYSYRPFSVLHLLRSPFTSYLPFTVVEDGVVIIPLGIIREEQNALFGPPELPPDYSSKNVRELLADLLGIDEYSPYVFTGNK